MRMRDIQLILVALVTFISTALTPAFAYSVYDNATIGTGCWGVGFDGSTNNTHQILFFPPCNWPSTLVYNISTFNLAWNNLYTTSSIGHFEPFTSMTNGTGYTEYFAYNTFGDQKIHVYDTSASELGSSSGSFAGIVGLDNYSSDFSGSFNAMQFFILIATGPPRVELVNMSGNVLDTLNIPTMNTGGGSWNKLAVDSQNRTFIFLNEYYGGSLTKQVVVVYNFTSKALIGSFNLNLWNIPDVTDGQRGSIWVNNSVLWYAQNELGSPFISKVYSLNYTQGLSYGSGPQTISITYPTNTTYTTTSLGLQASVNLSFNSSNIYWYINDTLVDTTNYTGAPTQATITADSGTLGTGQYNVYVAYRDTNNNWFNSSRVYFSIALAGQTGGIGHALGQFAGVSDQNGVYLLWFMVALSVSLAFGIIVKDGLVLTLMFVLMTAMMSAVGLLPAWVIILYIVLAGAFILVKGSKV